MFAAGIILFLMINGPVPPFNTATPNDEYYSTFCRNHDEFWDFHAEEH